MLPSHVFAQSTKEEGKRLGMDLKPMVEDTTKAPVTADTVPEFQTDSPTEQEYYDNPSRIETNAAVGPRYKRLSPKMRHFLNDKIQNCFLWPNRLCFHKCNSVFFRLSCHNTYKAEP
jgi:hypothetical protein